MAFLSNITNLILIILIFFIPNASAVAVVNITQITHGTNMSYGNPSWSADCSKIAYSAGTADEHYYIWVINSDGSNPIQVTDGKGVVDLNPSWSPDCSKIIFLRTLGDGSSFIYIINSDGSNLKKLLGATGNPAVSPDGHYIAFDAGGVDGVPVTPEQGYGIYVMNIDGTNIKRLTDDFGDEVVPSWSPDGKKIVFSRGGTIHIMNSDGSNMTSTGQGGYFTRWSPDGKHIAFLSGRAGDRFRSMELYHIYVMDIDGTNITQLTFGNNRSDGLFDWSPDSTKIIFGSAVPPTAPTSVSNLYIMTLDFNLTTPVPTLTSTQTPMVTQISTITPTATTTPTPGIPGFSLMVALVSLFILVFVIRRKG